MSTANEAKEKSPIREVRIFDAPTQSKIWEAIPGGSPLKVVDIESFEFYQSIYDPFYRAKLRIFESSGEFEKAFGGCGVRNFCMVEIDKFVDPMDGVSGNVRDITDLSFTSGNCFFISKVTQTIQGKKQVYELELVTRDSLSSLASSVMFSWPNETDYNFIINDLMLRWIYSTKIFDTQKDKSKPQTKYSGNGMQPFQVIKDICKKATSIRWSASGSQQESGATGYMFFETSQDYKFTSIASLINLDSGENIKESHKYTVSISNDSETTETEKAYRIISYKFNEQGETSDIIQEIRSNKRGKPTTFVLDTTGQKYKKIESLDPIKDPCETTSVDGSFVRNTYKEVGYYEYSFYNSCENDLENKPTHTSLTTLNYSALLEELRSRNSVLRVPGNLSISAGEKILIVVPEIKGDGSNDTQLSNKYSGIYVVTKVAHRLENYKFVFTDLVIVKIKESSGATVTVPQ